MNDLIVYYLLMLVQNPAPCTMNIAPASNLKRVSQSTIIWSPEEATLFLTPCWRDFATSRILADAN